VLGPQGHHRPRRPVLLRPPARRPQDACRLLPRRPSTRAPPHGLPGLQAITSAPLRHAHAMCSAGALTSGCTGQPLASYACAVTTCLVPGAGGVSLLCVPAIQHHRLGAPTQHGTLYQCLSIHVVLACEPIAWWALPVGQEQASLMGFSGPQGEPGPVGPLAPPASRLKSSVSQQARPVPASAYALIVHEVTQRKRRRARQITDIHSFSLTQLVCACDHGSDIGRACYLEFQHQTRIQGYDRARAPAERHDG